MLQCDFSLSQVKRMRFGLKGPEMFYAARGGHRKSWGGHQNVDN